MTKKIVSFLTLLVCLSANASAQFTERYTNAVEMASTLHANQTRKGTEIPYISHLLNVSSLVIEYGGTEDEAIAGLLHDAVEDAGGLPVLKKIENTFGKTVAQIVSGTTEHWEGTVKPDWKTRKNQYLVHLEKANRSVLLVAACDKLHNIRAILSDYLLKGDDLWNRFNATANQTLWFYKTCGIVFQSRKGEKQIQHLGKLILRTVSDLETLQLSKNPKNFNPFIEDKNKE